MRAGREGRPRAVVLLLDSSVSREYPEEVVATVEESCILVDSCRFL